MRITERLSVFHSHARIFRRRHRGGRRFRSVEIEASPIENRKNRRRTSHRPGRDGGWRLQFEPRLSRSEIRRRRHAFFGRSFEHSPLQGNVQQDDHRCEKGFMTEARRWGIRRNLPEGQYRSHPPRNPQGPRNFGRERRGFH